MCTHMIIGIRDLRTKIASLVLHVQKENKIVVVTKNNKPSVAIIAVDQLKQLAEKSDTKEIIEEINKANHQGNESFQKYLQLLIDDTTSMIELSKANNLPEESTNRLQNILSVYTTIVDPRGEMEDERLTTATSRKMMEVFSQILEVDYYNISQKFLKAVKKAIVELVSPDNSLNLSHSYIDDLRQLDDILKNAKVSEKSNGEKVERYKSVLTKIVKNDKLYSYKIYTFIPFEYKGKHKLSNFTRLRTPIGKALWKKVVGEEVKHRGYTYRIEAVT